MTGTNLLNAYSIACRIEMAAKVYFLALQVGAPATLSDEQITEIRNVYLKK